MSNGAKKFLREFLIIVAYGALVVLWLFPASLSPTHLIASLKDSDFSQALWVIEHYQPLEQAFSNQAFPPKGVDYSYIHWMVVPILVAKLFQALFGLVACYNILTMMSLSAACYGSYRLGLELKLTPWGAGVAGMAYGICPYLAGQVLAGHFYYVFGAALVPFYLLAFHRFLNGDGPRLVSGLWVVALWLVLMRSCIYYCLFLIPVCVVWAVVFVLGKKIISLRTSGLLLVGGVFCSALNLGQSKESADTALLMPRSHMQMFDADLLAAITPSPYHPIWGSQFARLADKVGFLGFTILGLAIWQLVRKKSLTLSALAVAAWLVAIGPVLYVGGSTSLVLPWASLFSLPGYGSIQVYGRAMLIVQLLVALVAAGAVQSQRTGMIAGLCVLFEFWIAPVPVYDSNPSQIFTEIRNGPPGTVVSIPYRPQNTEPLFHQVHHGHSGLRAPVLRPSSQLNKFYDEFQSVAGFGLKDGHKNLTASDAVRLQGLVRLRYFALDKERLGEAQTESWEQALSQLFPVENRWSNNKFTIFQVGDLPLDSGSLILELDSPFQGFCATGLGGIEEQGGQKVRFVRKLAQIWLPIQNAEKRTLSLSGQVTDQVSGIVSWNDNHLGEILWYPGQATSSWEIQPEWIVPGANEIKIELVPGSAPLGLNRVTIDE